MPLAAVCPVHGAFRSRAFGGNMGHNMTIMNSSEPCPKCGRRSKVSEGVFDFDDGIVTVISAPSWSRAAIQAVQEPLREAAEALRNESLSDEDAYAVLSEKLDRVLAAHGSTDQNVRELTAEVRSLRARLTRTKLASILLAIVFVLGMISDAGGAIDAVGDLLEWATSQYEAGLEPAEAPAPRTDAPGVHQPGESFGIAAARRSPWAVDPNRS